MWNVKYDTDEPIYETETKSGTERTDLVVAKDRRWGERGGMGAGDQSMQTGIYRMDKQQGNYIFKAQGTIFNIL